VLILKRLSRKLHSNYDGANYVNCGDLDEDGDIDILASASGCDQLAYWENLGNKIFRKHVITTNFNGCRLSPVDIDFDHDIDIIAVARNPGEFAWFENSS